MANDLMTEELEARALTEVKTGTELAPVGLTDAFAAYADAVAPQYIIGEMLRFVKGDYFAGKETPVELGTTFTANLDELMAGSLKWIDSKPVEHLMVRVADGIAPKKRHELGDLDKAQWEVGKDGKPKDPWQFTNYLPMMNDKGELFTFVTASRGGIGAIADLARRYSRHRKHHPDVFPVIKLEVDSYQHKDRDLGRIKFPVFEAAGYVPKTDFLAALATAGYSAHEPEPVEADPNEDFDDKVPF